MSVWVWFLALSPDFNLLPMQNLWGSSSWCSNRVPGTHMGKLGCVNRFRLTPSLTPAICGVNQHIGALSLSVKLKKKSNKEKMLRRHDTGMCKSRRTEAFKESKALLYEDESNYNKGGRRRKSKCKSYWKYTVSNLWHSFISLKERREPASLTGQSKAAATLLSHHPHCSLSFDCFALLSPPFVIIPRSLHCKPHPLPGC